MPLFVAEIKVLGILYVDGCRVSFKIIYFFFETLLQWNLPITDIPNSGHVLCYVSLCNNWRTL